MLDSSVETAYPSEETARSPVESCIHTELCCVKIEVISERPSGATATPSSSSGPDVICSGCPSGKRCRHKCCRPSMVAPKYIQRPSGDQPADVQAPAGPTRLPRDPPAMGTKRHGSQSGSISTTSTHWRSCEA